MHLQVADHAGVTVQRSLQNAWPIPAMQDYPHDTFLIHQHVTKRFCKERIEKGSFMFFPKQSMSKHVQTPWHLQNSPFQGDIAQFEWRAPAHSIRVHLVLSPQLHHPKSQVPQVSQVSQVSQSKPFKTQVKISNDFSQFSIC